MQEAKISIPTVHPKTLALAEKFAALRDGDGLVAEARVLALSIIGISGELDQLEAQLNAVLVPGMKLGEVRKSVQST